MKLVTNYDDMNKGYDLALKWLSAATDKVTLTSIEGRSFKAAIPSFKRKVRSFSFPSAIGDVNRLTHIGVDDLGKIHLLRQTPSDMRMGGGLNFCDKSGIPFAMYCKRQHAPTEPVWLDFGILENTDFVDVFVAYLHAYLKAEEVLLQQH